VDYSELIGISCSAEEGYVQHIEERSHLRPHPASTTFLLFVPASVMTASMTSTDNTELTISCHQEWIWNAFAEAHVAFITTKSRDRACEWSLSRHIDLWPLDDVRCGDALWCTPDFLTAQNARMSSHGLTPLRMLTPQKDWPTRLGRELLGRSAVESTVGAVLNWGSYDDSGLADSTAPGGCAPWSQLVNGRVPDFPAAQRDLPVLQQALAHAPADSHILVSTHVPDIAEEWMVVVHRGCAIAAQGYCIHQPVGSRNIISVFDGAAFTEDNIEHAMQLAEAGAKRLDIDSVVMNIAFRSDSRALVLEALPTWCTPLYAYPAQATGQLLQAIADCSLPDEFNPAESSAGGDETDSQVFQPDSWMKRCYASRFAN
jgi:hypothetical protein